MEIKAVRLSKLSSSVQWQQEFGAEAKHDKTGQQYRQLILHICTDNKDNLYIIMDTKLVIIATFLCSVLVMYTVTGDPLEDQLPDTTGLFFGKRASHPNLNNLLFGRRSYGQLQSKLMRKEMTRMCEAVLPICSNSKYLMEEDNGNN